MDNDALFEINISGKLSDEVNWLIAYNYWKAQTEKKFAQEEIIASEVFRSNELKIALNFLMVRIFDISLIFEQSLYLGKNTKAYNAVFAFGESFKLKAPLFINRTNLVVSGNYHNAFELMNFGGGIHYSMLSYLIGIEINIKD